jgi:hypothetical protein
MPIETRASVPVPFCRFPDPNIDRSSPWAETFRFDWLEEGVVDDCNCDCDCDGEILELAIDDVGGRPGVEGGIMGRS